MMGTMADAMPVMIHTDQGKGLLSSSVWNPMSDSVPHALGEHVTLGVVLVQLV